VSLGGLEFPPDLALGLVTGMTYALVGLGLTLIYRTNRTLNFAHGETGAVAAVLVPLLIVNLGVPYWLALLAALAVPTLVGLLIEVTVIRRLWHAPRLLVLVATIGLAQLLVVLQLLIPRGDLGARTFPVPFQWSWKVGGVVLSPGHLMILFFVPIITVLLTWVMRRTKLGLASRATADNESAAQLTGIPIHRVSTAIWTVAGLLAGLSAVLIGPTRPLLATEALGATLILRGLVAALVGGFRSLPWTFAGGVAVGVLEFWIQWNWPTGGALELVLLGLVLALLLFRRGLSASARGGEERSWALSESLPALPPSILKHGRVQLARWGSRAAVLAIAVVLPALVSASQQTLMTNIVLFALVGCSLVVLTGYAGQVSLGQFAFVALGAVVGGRLQSLGWPPGSAIVFVGVAGALVAAVVGIPALRIRGLYLAVATLSFAFVSISWMLDQDWLVAQTPDGLSLRIDRPNLFGVDFAQPLPFYWLCLAALVLIGAAVSHLRNTGIGRAMIAVRDNEPAAATLSVSPRTVKMTAFALSGVIASVAGWFYGAFQVSFSSNPRAVFSIEESLVLLAIVIFGGVTTVTGVIVGAIWLKGLAYWMAPLLGSTLGPRVAVLIGGAGLLTAVLQFPQGLAVEIMTRRDRLFQRLVGEIELEPPVKDDVASSGRARLPVRLRNGDAPDPDHPPIACEHVTVRFGGIRAVDDVSLHADVGEIVGLIGPNGAGKTTLFDVLTGQLAPTAGRVLVSGHDVGRLRPEHRALLGIGRSFQQARLFEDLTPFEAFKVGLERGEPSELIPSLLSLPPSTAAERRKSVRADELVGLLGLGEHAHRSIAGLSTGTRRFVELGCMIALDVPVLLLDEPTAGIAQREVEAFRPVLREVRDHLDATIVLIDHDLPTVVDLVDRLYVLSSGQVIAEGPPRQVRDDPAVIAAYLGTDQRAVARSNA